LTVNVRDISCRNISAHLLVVLRTEELIETVLKLSKGREFYGYDLHKKITSEVVGVEIGRFYRILAVMVHQGLLESHWEKSSSGPRRRMYLLSKKGRKELNRILLEAIETVHDFYGDYLLNLPAALDVFDRIGVSLTKGLNAKKNAAYVVAADYNPMDDRILSALGRRIPQGTLYLAKPLSVHVEPKIESPVVLDAAIDNIPLKDDYLDALMVRDIPPGELLENAVREWHRLLRKDGRLGILAPTVTLRNHMDPLTIGDFIEKYEHELEATRKSEHADGELLRRLFRKFFQNLEEITIVHMTLLVGFNKRSLSRS